MENKIQELMEELYGTSPNRLKIKRTLTQLVKETYKDAAKTITYKSKKKFRRKRYPNCQSCGGTGKHQRYDQGGCVESETGCQVCDPLFSYENALVSKDLKWEEDTKRLANKLLAKARKLK